MSKVWERCVLQLKKHLGLLIMEKSKETHTQRTKLDTQTENEKKTGWTNEASRHIKDSQ